MTVADMRSGDFIHDCRARPRNGFHKAKSFQQELIRLKRYGKLAKKQQHVVVEYVKHVKK